MDISKYTLEDTYNEYPIGEDMTGVCSKCGFTGQVRVMTSKDYNSGIITKIGPFDRKCAYELKIGTPPPYNTMPHNWRQLLYRLITKEELPFEDHMVNRVLWRIWYLTMLVILLFLIPVSISWFVYWGLHQIGFNISPWWFYLVLFFLYLAGPIAFMDIDSSHSSQSFILIFQEMPTKVFYKQTFQNLKQYPLFFPYLPLVFPMLTITLLLMIPVVMLGFIVIIFSVFLLPFAILSLFILPFIAFKQVKNFIVFKFKIISRLITSKNIGKNHIEHYELFWEGKVNFEDKSQRFYHNMVMLNIFSLVVMVLSEVFLPNLNSGAIFSEFFDENLPQLVTLTSISEIPINFITFPLLAIPILFMISAIRRSIRGSFIKYYAMPEDIHNKILDEYKENLDKQEKGKKETSTIKQLLNSLRFSNDSVSKLSCMICKAPIEKEDVLSKCPVCRANYHEDHLEEYIKSQQSNGKSPKCAVCKFEFTPSINQE